ncbi:unnamed protein product [Kuraishia capsulata CBS 1993]|uniref:Vacuolar protein sorting-associated protein 55 n=1 Tax=Kuraishia capsulata CBS 1993 TaxID=1382522 RepID=W6MVB4_9ASCO|nr:uncharacterized protein KUCA_T00005861001 [Kuraishia capsulata CBS 1993]CDK29867.1 unnamed protein product [Kuraishia capsulata CBS 1993]
MPQINPLTKIIGLSSVLAAGFLLIVLAGAIYGNWFPVVAVIIFGFAHLPILITQHFENNYDDFMSEAAGYAIDLGRFLSSFLLTTGIAFPLILNHCHILTKVATVLTISGGLLVYGTVVTFASFFDADSEEATFEI